MATRLSSAAFDLILRDAIADLPADFQQVLERVPVIVEPVCPASIRRVVPDADELLGLYTGPPLEEWDAGDALPETAVIHLFQRPIEEASRSRRELCEQVRITLRHELGHALGFDETDLDRMGLG